MEMVKDCKLVCGICQREFSRVSTKNRHIRNFYDGVTIEKNIQRIQCPLCLEEEKFSCYDHLIEHLKRFISVEKLLDLLDELVDEKMWKRIINTERPNANNYQHKITVEAHKKVKQMKDNIQCSEFGKFKVQSCTVNNKFYLVSYNEICDEDCRTSYCSQCKICIHRYLCECPEYAVKCTICKHIHAVVLFEGRSESVLGLSSSWCSKESEVFYIDEPTTNQIRYQNDLTDFLDENGRCQNTLINFENRRELWMEFVDLADL